MNKVTSDDYPNCLDLDRCCPCRVGGWRCCSYEQMCQCEDEMEEPNDE